MTMISRLGGWEVTLPGTGVDAHLVRARKEHRCSSSAHYLTRRAGPADCGQTIRAGEVYVKVRTGAWPNPDSPMTLEHAEAAGWVRRNESGSPDVAGGGGPETPADEE